MTGFAPDRTCFNQLMGCLHPSSDGRRGKTRSISPTQSFLLPTHDDISGTTEDIFMYPLLAVCLLPAQPGCPPEISGEDRKSISFFFFIFAFSTFLIIYRPCWRWGRKLKDIKSLPPIYPDACSNSCSNSFLSSSDSYPSAPTELPKVPAPLQTLPLHPSHSRLWIPKDKASSMWLLTLVRCNPVNPGSCLFLSVSVILTQTFPKHPGYRGQTPFFPGMSECV